ncbi:KR-domain-containing protein [Aspergillus fijiensis CBS 313.89]|uniref:KR-domain-containing protein n=1 Tax=Aspergillus fijiensis CBS 313.89 TaxID=1448319 RepID=A0A8G1W2G6_9EURO|nr:KR-domain-containing protein [Aspergillus fijiensis CBS 313.89]RAK81482.1 KR-domain-containing protein [Aspergillus fijiensis CBS 313.89]
MGFDFGVGDFLAALQFAKTLGRRFVDAPNEFQALSQEVQRLSTVLQAIDDLDPQDAPEDRQKQRLNRISRECGDALDELWRFLDQYQQVNRDDEERCDAGTRTRTSRSLRRLPKQGLLLPASRRGRVDFLDVMIRDGTLTSVYDWMNNALDISEFFQLLGHMQPQMRALEIGAGTGGLTAKVLSNLRSAYGERLYLQYTFTDISSGSFSAARNRFQDYETIEYKVLDISQDPLEQGFQGEVYDLIIASNVLHATPCLHDTLVQVRNLLKSEGRLFLQELSPVFQSMAFVMDLISFLDLDHPFLQAPSQADWDLFLQMVQRLQQSSVLWLSSLTQMQAQDPHEALILGMTRTIRSELAMPLATLELESHDSLAAADAVVRVFMQLQRSNEAGADDLDPDMEFCWANVALHVGRYHWYPVKEALRGPITEPETKALRVKKRGLLQFLYWSGGTLPELAADQVQIRTQAVGMNYKDVLMAMGVVDGGLPNIALGKKGAGYVTKVGADVGHLQVGDRELYLNNTTSSLATEAQTLGRLTVRIPDTLGFEDAATMPAVYVTLGLEIYCTVGSEPKAAFLVREHGIPRDRIFYSRNASFQDDIMVATNDIGVDCVLNSLSGELLHASWQCVAACGCMVEIGKRDMLGRGQLALDRFEDNRAYIGLDLALSVVAAPAQVSRHMKRMLDLYADGHIRPIHPVTFYDAHDVQEAFRYMQTGSHIGKVVIRMSEDTNRALQWRPETPKPSFRQDRAYLLVGGMGGLGKAIATWMVTHGAKHLIFLSRSAGASEEDQEFIHELSLRGCAVQAIAGDVAYFDTVQNVIDRAPRPIAGVMQMAMVLCDVGILDMTVDDYRTPLRPKVDGTWNLHRALGPSNEDLDFFVMFSSVGGQVGYWGQGNYAAANTFLDAFVHYRHAQGLPASVHDIGAINDVGFISQNPAVRSAMEAGSARLFTEQDFLDTLQLTISRSSARPPYDGRPPGTAAKLGQVFHNPSQVSQVMESRLPITHPDNRIIWKRDPRMAIYRNIETVAAQGEDATGGGSGGSSSSSMLKSFLAEVSTDPARLQQPAAAEFLAGELLDRVADFLMRRAEDGAEPLDLDMSLTEVGVDSLVAIKLRNWWKQDLAVEVSASESKSGGSILELGELAARRLQEKVLGNGQR